MKTTPSFRALLRNAAAVFLGLVAIVVLSIGTHDALHRLRLLSFLVLYDTRWNLLILSLECAYVLIGGYVTGKVASTNALPFSLAVGGFRAVWFGSVAIFRFNTYDTGPVWLPVALMLAALPCAWLGACLASRKAAG